MTKPTARDAAYEVMQSFEVGEFVSYEDVAALTVFNKVTISGVLSQLMREGHLEKGTRGMYARRAVPLAQEERECKFELVKVRADGSRIMTDEAGELYIVTLVVI